MWTKTWWRKVADRAAKTAAQTFILTVGSDMLGWMKLDWKFIAVAVVGMAALSFATSVATTKVGDDKQDPGIWS